MQIASKLQLIALCLAVLAMLGQKLGVLPFKLAFPGFGIALLIVIVLGLFALLAFIWSLIKSNDAIRGPSLRMLLIGLLPLAVVAAVVGPGLSAPPIHDISTDLSDPPVFVVAKAARTVDENSTDYEGEVIAKQQREAYPELKPIDSSLDLNAAYDRSITLIEELGWAVLAEDRSSGRIEAVQESALFGFKDDIVIRIRAQSEGTRIDLRSNSRVGVGDLGANAARIQQFVDAF